MSGASARRKGHSYERAVARELRTLGFDARTAREVDPTADPAGVDIVQCPPLAIQCTAVERIGSLHTLLGAIDRPGHYPVIYHKRNRQGETVTLRKEDFHEMVAALIKERIWKV